jgi:hypothetical protein
MHQISIFVKKRFLTNGREKLRNAQGTHTQVLRTHQIKMGEPVMLTRSPDRE